MAVHIPVRLQSLENEVQRQHGSMRDLTVDERNVIDHHAQVIMSDIEGAWPVDTGYSRDQWRYQLRIRPTLYELLIDNDASYVEFVHLAGQPPTPPLWETLVPAVLRAQAPLMLADFRAAVMRTEALLQRTTLPRIQQRQTQPRPSTLTRILRLFGAP